MAVDKLSVAMLISVVIVGVIFSQKSTVATTLCGLAGILLLWHIISNDRKDRKEKKNAKEKAVDSVKSAVDTGEPVARESDKPTVSTGAPTAVTGRTSEHVRSSSNNKSRPDSSAPKEKKSREELWGIPTLRVRDYNGQTVPINSEKPVPFHSDFFTGKLLFMARTEGEYEKYNRYRQHFKGVKRKFEIQVQGRFKELPRGIVMMGGELPEKLVLGVMTRAIISMAMKFAARLIANMSFSFGEDPTPDGNYERPFMSFPMYRAMDRITITPEGEEPPTLGKELPEEDQVRSDRRGGRGPEIQFEIGPTYSFSFHSMYIDFPNWALCNVAGYKHIAFDTFFGRSLPHIVVYDFDKNISDGKHTARSKRYLSDLELCHANLLPPPGVLGEDANGESVDEENDADYAAMRGDRPRAGSNSSNDSVDDGRSTNLPDAAAALLASPSSDMLSSMSGDLNTSSPQVSTLDSKNGPMDEYGPPIKAGMEVPFVALPLGWEMDAGSHPSKITAGVDDEIYSIRSTATGAAWLSSLANTTTTSHYMGIGEHDGQAVRWRIPYSHNMRLIKVSASGNKDASDIVSGDTVMIQSVNTSFYLGAYRGFFLTWSQSMPSDTKGHFIVAVVDATNGATRAGKLRVGMPFRLRSARWPSYEVGIECTTAAKKSISSRMLTADGTRHMDSMVLYEWTANCPLLASKAAYFKPSKHSRSANSGPGAVTASRQRAYSTTVAVKAASPLYICGISYPRAPLNLISTHPHLFQEPVDIGTVPADLQMDVQTIMLLNSMADQQATSSSSSSTGMSGSSTIASKFATHGINVSIIGWVDILHRTTCSYEVAYVVTVTVDIENPTKGLSDNHNKWCIIRSGQEIDSMLSLLETFEKRFRDDAGNSSPMSADNLAEVIPKQHETMTSQVQKQLSYRLRKCVQNKNLCSSIEFQKLISEFILKPNIYDSWFLSGGIMQLYPPTLVAGIRASNSLLTVGIARALWDGEWREEMAVLTENSIYFYLPIPTTAATGTGNSKYCSKQIHIHDIVGVSHIYDNESPLPGFAVIRIETIGRVHYLAFNNVAEKDRMMIELSQQINNLDLHGVSRPSNLHTGAAVAAAVENDRFVLHSRQWTPSSRMILNAKVFMFDRNMIDSAVAAAPSSKKADWNAAAAFLKSETLCDLSVRLLNNIHAINMSIGTHAKSRMLLQESGGVNDECRNLKPLEFGCCHESTRTMLSSFLMEVCQLKHVNLSGIDLKSREALCFFINIYHTLLLHARLVLGRPQKQNWAAFFRDACYEIGGDVFSLAELEHCVIKGNLAHPHPHAVRKGYVNTKLPSPADDHFMYCISNNQVAQHGNSSALLQSLSDDSQSTVDKRVHFLLNDGSLSCPSKIFIMTPQHYDKICMDAAQLYLSDSIQCDVRRWSVMLPRVCDIYRGDFGDDNFSILQQCKKMVDFSIQNEIQDVLNVAKHASSVVIKFHKYALDSRKNMELVTVE